MMVNVVRWVVRDRWEESADKDVVKVANEEAFEEVVNHAKDNNENNALDVAEQYGQLLLGVLCYKICSPPKLKLLKTHLTDPV